MANGTISVSQVDVLTTSGTGTISIVPPATNTNRTLTLPDATGKVVVDSSGGSVSTNTAVGINALVANTTGSYNTAFGNAALKSNTTAGDSTAIGAGALETSTGQSNTAVGAYALNLNSTGTFNTAVGRLALYANTTGENNTAVGYTAADAVTSAQKVVAIGFNAGGAITTGNSNVCVGADSGAAITTGTLNIALGRENLQSLTTGSYNTHIGYATSAGAAARASAMVICSGPNGATDKGDNTGFIAPNSNGAVYQGNNSSSWSTTSDQRLKKNIVDNTEGLEKINSIRVCNFEYRLPEEITELSPSDAIKRSGVQLGVIAQELQQVCPDCVKEETTGVLSVDSDNIFWHMVNAIKDLKAINDAQATRIEALETKVAALEAK